MPGESQKAETMKDLVNLDRHPINSLGSTEGERLIRRCRADLDEKALCTLHDFIHPAARREMIREVEALSSDAFYYQKDRVAYDPDGHEYPEDHPRSITHRCSYDQIMNDQIPRESLIRKLYTSKELTEFVRQVLGYNTLYQTSCPYLSLSVQVGREGDANGWHFDGNDAVFSLLLQEPEAGGEFEYAPYIRSLQDENYRDVAEVMKGTSTQTERPSVEAGTLSLFKGDLSLHRVRKIQGDRPRMIALFCYDQQPHKVFDPAYVNQVRSRGVRPAGSGASSEN